VQSKIQDFKKGGKMTRENLFRRNEVRRIDEDLVRSVPQPEFTPTWKPYSHAQVIDATAIAVEKNGLTVRKKTYSLDVSGANMFGLWEVGKRNGKMNCIGFRNSVNKQLSIGYTSVLTIVVCTNQITHANWFLLRRHTAMLTVASLSKLAQGAVDRVVQDFNVTDRWHEDLKNYEIKRRKAELLTVRAMREEVLSPSKFLEFDALLFGAENKKPVYDLNLHGFHGALTQLIRDNNLHVLAIKNKQITNFINDVKQRIH